MKVILLTFAISLAINAAIIGVILSEANQYDRLGALETRVAEMQP